MEPVHEHESTLLNPGAEYGNLPFDQFVLTNWDFDKAEENDQEQWNDLASRWLSMSHIDRSPYWRICSPADSPHPDAPYLPPQSQIQRILAPHQTITERNVTQKFLSHIPHPIWIRTCYAVELDTAYQEMFEGGQTDFGPEIVLDDESLYGQYGHDWTKVFLRLPQLIDSVVYYNDGHPEDDESRLAISPPNDEARLPLYNAVMKSKSIYYLFDEEAVQEKLVKVHFLDIHGQSVWYNKIRPDHIQDFEAGPSGGHLSGHLENCGDDPSLLDPGTLLYAEE